MEQIIEIIAEVLKYVVPAILVLLTVKFMNDHSARKAAREESQKLRSEVLKNHLPLKLSAYERAVLYLERISPENLVPRISTKNKTVARLQAEFLNEIQSEYEHNLVQQLYISFKGWSALVNAKNEMTRIVNLAASELKPDGPGVNLSKKILEKCAEWEDLPTHKAAFALKSDILDLFSVK